MEGIVGGRVIFTCGFWYVLLILYLSWVVEGGVVSSVIKQAPACRSRHFLCWSDKNHLTSFSSFAVESSKFSSSQTGLLQDLYFSLLLSWMCFHMFSMIDEWTPYCTAREKEVARFQSKLGIQTPPASLHVVMIVTRNAPLDRAKPREIQKTNSKKEDSSDKLWKIQPKKAHHQPRQKTPHESIKSYQ